MELIISEKAIKRIEKIKNGNKEKEGQYLDITIQIIFDDNKNIFNENKNIKPENVFEYIKNKITNLLEEKKEEEIETEEKTTEEKIEELKTKQNVLKIGKIEYIKINNEKNLEDYSEKSFKLKIKILDKEIEQNEIFLPKSKIVSTKNGIYIPIWILENNKAIINCKKIIEI